MLAATRDLEEQHLTNVDRRMDVLAITSRSGPRVLILEHNRDTVEGRIP
jgi:hypothetical protein